MAPPLIRTDFSDDAAWAGLVDYLLTERMIDDIGEMMSVFVAPIDDRQYEDMTMEEMLEMVPHFDYDPSDPAIAWDLQPKHFPGEPERALHAYIVDRNTFSTPDRLILAVNFFLDHGENFRLTADAMAMVEAHLSIGNLSFSDFIGAGIGPRPDGRRAKISSLSRLG